MLAEILEPTDARIIVVESAHLLVDSRVSDILLRLQELTGYFQEASITL